MSHMFYRVTSSDILFDGANNTIDMSKDPYYFYEGEDREKSLDLARK